MWMIESSCDYYLGLVDAKENTALVKKTFAAIGRKIS